MIYHDFEAFLQELPPGRPLMGLDYGRKTIGVAISDVEHTIATPYYTVRRQDQKKDIGRLWQIATERKIGGVVIGMPLSMDGSDGPRAQSTRAFARALEMAMPRPLTYWDERLSTVAAERALLEADASRAKRGIVIDKVAAAIILQGALDRIGFLSGKSSTPAGATPTEPEEAPAPPQKDDPPAMARAGRARPGRALPTGPEAPPKETAPKRDADALRRRRMMTRRINPDE